MGVPIAATSASADDEPFLIEGTLTELHVELGKENLLAKIDEHYRAKSVATGVAAAAGDLFGQAANAAMLAMYDGEDTQNFVCLVNGEVMCGQFGGAEMLKEGGSIRAVVSRKEGVLSAHAIMSPTHGLLWVTHPWGLKAEAAANTKMALWFCLLGAIFFGLVAVLFDGFTVAALRNFGMVVGALVLLSVIMAIWANSDMKGLAGASTDMFRLLGFDKPEHINLNNYSLKVVSIRDHLKNQTATYPTQDLAEYQHRNVYCYQRAIDDGKLFLKG